MKLQLIFLLIFQVTALTNGYKILAIFSASSKSQLFGFLPLAHELASRGHDLTLIHSQPKLAMPSSIKTIVLPDIAKLIEATIEKPERIRKDPLTSLSVFRNVTSETCKHFLQSKETQALLKAGKQFDLVIVLSIANECGMAIAPLIGKHLILHHPVAFFSTFPSPAPSPPSIITNPILGYPTKMTFRQRFLNFIVTNLMRIVYKYYLITPNEATLAKMVPEAPSVWDAWNNAALTLVNQDVVTSSPRPTVPNVVPVPGMSCVPPKPLPKELDQFMQSSGSDGVIVVGLGSVALSKLLPRETIQMLLKVFGKLRQKVIWKYEDDGLVVPPNVKTLKWMPQQDILGHPKTKLFISLGGLQSMQETVYHGVPVIGIPISGDQIGNVVRMKEIGVGEYVNIDEVTSDEFYDTIMKILNDQSYYERIKKYSAIFRDNLQPPVKTAAFWVEYVARHNGARHLRTVGQDMCLFQYFLVDVIAFLTLVPTLSFYLLYRIVKYVWRKHKSCRQKKAETKKKTQ